LITHLSNDLLHSTTMSDPISDHNQELIAGYALRSLTQAEMQQVAAMVAEDPQLQALLNEYQSLMAVMAEPPPRKEPDGLKARILGSIDQRSPSSMVAQQPILSTSRPNSGRLPSQDCFKPTLNLGG
jgi:anti-sigma factor ChrR (cupin superfamily)